MAAISEIAAQALPHDQNIREEAKVQQNSPRTAKNLHKIIIIMGKVKAKSVMVLVRSVVSGHAYACIRERLGDKLEILRFDPWIRQMCIYKEDKKIRSMKATEKNIGRRLISNENDGH